MGNINLIIQSNLEVLEKSHIDLLTRARLSVYTEILTILCWISIGINAWATDIVWFELLAGLVVVVCVRGLFKAFRHYRRRVNYFRFFKEGRTHVTELTGMLEQGPLDTGNSRAFHHLEQLEALTAEHEIGIKVVRKPMSEEF